MIVWCNKVILKAIKLKSIMKHNSFLESPAKAASQALLGLKQQLLQQHNENQRQRQSQERASSELGFHGNQQTVSLLCIYYINDIINIF